MFVTVLFCCAIDVHVSNVLVSGVLKFPSLKPCCCQYTCSTTASPPLQAGPVLHSYLHVSSDTIASGHSSCKEVLCSVFTILQPSGLYLSHAWGAVSANRTPTQAVRCPSQCMGRREGEQDPFTDGAHYGSTFHAPWDAVRAERTPTQAVHTTAVSFAVHGTP